MPEKFPISAPKPPQKSLESLKETFKQRLDVVLNKQLTVENIQIFADAALIETVRLMEDILVEYRSNPNVHPDQIPLDKKIQEDEACKIFGLPDVGEILQSIIDVKDKIYAIGRYINESNVVVNKILVPPQPDSPAEIKSGLGQGVEDKKLIPRLITLLYILETDFNIKKEQVKITEGKVAPEMVRKTPYVRVEVEDLDRIVYICDEEGNASYVFDTEKLQDAGIAIEDLDVSDKGVMNELIDKHPGTGARIIQTVHWKMNMSGLLGNTITEKERGPKEKLEKPISEFVKREKKEFLSFEKFQEEVRTLYPGKGDVHKWYHTERLKHVNWPASPNKVYKNKGWKGWSDLVNKENPKRREFLPLDQLRAEVMILYPGEGDVKKWYVNEKKNHKNWPSQPEINYKNEGWIDWSELVGRENPLKKNLSVFLYIQERSAKNLSWTRWL